MKPNFCDECLHKGTKFCDCCLIGPMRYPTMFAKNKGIKIPIKEMETIEPITHKLPEPKADRHLAICRRLNETYRKKNADYGNSFDRVFDENGEVTAIVRLKDKIYRLDELLRKSAEVTEEKKIETALDGANYFIMYAMKLMEKEND